jgi:hypothetical protein
MIFSLGADVLEFDNSYSYLRSKKVWYRVVVDLPSSTVVPFEEFNQQN